MTLLQEDLAKLSLADLQGRLGAPQDGLSQDEARRRLARYGPNELPEKKANPFLKFLASFWGPIPWMIEVAAILSLLVRHWADFGIILVLLVVNAVVGFWEEYQAGNAIAALKKKLALDGPGQARRRLGGDPGPRAGPGRPHPPAARRHRPRRRQAARGRSDRGRSIGPDRRITAGHKERRGCRLFRFDRQAG